MNMIGYAPNFNKNGQSRSRNSGASNGRRSLVLKTQWKN